MQTRFAPTANIGLAIGGQTEVPIISKSLISFSWGLTSKIEHLYLTSTLVSVWAAVPGGHSFGFPAHRQAPTVSGNFTDRHLNIMEHIKDVLTNYGVDNANIDKLESFESRDGFIVLDEDEFEKMQDYLKEFPVYQFLVPIMTDENSNYWCLYADGPLKNMICHLSHDEPSLEPRFRSLSSLIDTITEYPDSYDIYDFEDDYFDFPNRQVSPNYLQDKEIIGELNKIFEAETDDDQIRTQTAFSIMALASPTDIETIIYPFLDDEDMYVQERAIQILGFHKYKPAVDKLTELTVNAQHNGQTASKIALKKIRAS